MRYATARNTNKIGIQLLHQLEKIKIEIEVAVAMEKHTSLKRKENKQYIIHKRSSGMQKLRVIRFVNCDVGISAFDLLVCLSWTA